MTDKILCPWCGAEMYPSATAECLKTEWRACYICPDDPYVSSPEVGGFKTVEEALGAAKAAALRRYTPLLKPMTLEEVDEHVRSNDANPLWIEDKTGYPSDEWILAATVWQMCKIMRNRDEYGKTWRCWERKPTDEERSAAEWET